MTLRFGVFDHIEPVPGLGLDQIYRERLVQIERLDSAGFFTYHPMIPDLDTQRALVIRAQGLSA